MKAGIVIFPGINRERDMAIALRRSGAEPRMVWHQETDLTGLDLIVLPGGFSHGDYLRCGAMAAHSPVMTAVREHAARGGYLLGVCNGFQILTEAGLLPGALLQNAGQNPCPAGMRMVASAYPYRKANRRQVVTIPETYRRWWAARVTRSFQYARWVDGSTHVWMGRRKQPGRGEGSSGLRFDTLE
jgi:phosphoribosylformylglycinamidine (FGAM) synthase-like amidotransferase family enzyme